MEARIQTIGQALFSAVAAAAPTPLSRSWLHDRGMAWTMADPVLQRQLFLFIDALPGIRSDTAIVAQLHEYLAPVAGHLPWLARRLLASSRQAPPEVVATAVRLAAHELAGRFMLGSDPQLIAAHISRLHQRGRAFTVDWLGETVLTEAEADAYQQAYLRLIPVLARTVAAWSGSSAAAHQPAAPHQPAAAHQPAAPHLNVSIKLSALTSRFEPADVEGTSAAVCARLRPILRAVRAAGGVVNIDMEHHQFRDATLRIVSAVALEDEFRTWDGLGIAVQAYLRSCADDLAALLRVVRQRGAPLRVRLVKGAYWDHEQAIAAQRDWPLPVFRHKAATDANFEAQTRFLLHHHRELLPAIAGHNVRSLAHALALREELGIPPAAVEFQLLHGMADALQQALVDRGERVRVYCPVGELLPGIAYLVRRLLENTSNQGFVRAGFLEHRRPQELLMAPLVPPVAVAVRPPFSNHPPADFSREEHRQAMHEALAARDALGPTWCPLVIDGVELQRSEVLVSEDPSCRARIVGRASAASAADARRALAAAAAALPSWRDTPWAVRISCLRAAAESLAGERWQLSALLVREVGKSWREADGEVCEMIDFCRYYAWQAERLAAGVRVDVAGEINDTIYEARGVTVVIAPWNFPLAILGGMAVAALVTGNPVILKPAEQAPIIAAELFRHLRAAGIPASVLHYLPGDGEVVGPVLVEHPATALIAFTGSRAVGLGLNQQAARALAEREQVVRVIAEMGGKNAIIVDASADLDEAVAGVVASAFGYQGQKCSACSRVIVDQTCVAAFTARFIAAVQALVLGPADHPGQRLGPVIDEAARLRLEGQLAELRRTHHLAYAGDASASAAQGSFVAPHIFTDVDPTSALAQEELFGPVVAVITARDLEHALEIANGTRYALTGGCFARSPAVLARVRREFRVGNLYLNRGITGALVQRQPFGGFKLSGIGSKAGGPDYLQQFTVPRTLTENTLRHGMVSERE
jgi:RHH-type proline utilization regulon transcriptional repressor/proline dehydrogenase/delta 1-pyrroline-5-carboxylate dehydrogenase